MGAEHDVRLRDDALEFHVVIEFFVGVDDVELRHIATAHGVEARIVRNFLQGRGERPRVATEFGAARIGHVLARTRNGKAREPAEQVADGAPDQNKNQHKDDDNSTTSTAALIARSPTRSAEHCRKQFYRNRLKGRKNSHKHNANDHESRVAVLDVSEFMAHDGGEFRIVQFIDEAGRERNRKRGNVNAACKSVQARVLHNVDLRHFDTACNAEVFDNIIDAQVVLAFKGLGMCGVANNGGVCTIGDNEPHANNLERIRKHGPKSIPHFGPMH